jgi:hypothetical protein
MCLRLTFFGKIIALTTLALATTTFSWAQQPPSDSSSQNQAQGQGAGRMRGMGGFPGGGRGLLGSVTEVAADHYIIKTDSGETYTVHFSVNTRILKQGPERRRTADGSGGRQRGQGGSGDSDRPTPQALKPTDIKVGDVITAAGEVDTTAKSVGAVFILQVDPERAKQMREMQANFGKTWLGGRITAVEGTTITIEGMIDHAPHTIAVDENTSFHQRRDAITLADIKPGEQLRAEGAVQGGVFLATTVNAMPAQNRENRNQEPGTAAPNASSKEPK